MKKAITIILASLSALTLLFAGTTLAEDSHACVTTGKTITCTFVMGGKTEKLTAKKDAKGDIEVENEAGNVIANNTLSPDVLTTITAVMSSTNASNFSQSCGASCAK